MRLINNVEIKKLEDLYKKNKIDELEQEVKKLLKFENNNNVLLNILGVAYLKKKLFKEAEIIFNKILNKNPNDVNALKNLGETYRRVGKIGNATKYYELYLTINSNDNEVINNLASCYLKSKRYELAIKYYKILNKKNVQNDNHLTSLAFALIESLNFEEGIKILEKILDKDIHNRRAYDGYLFNQGYNPEANSDKISFYIKKFNQSYKKEKLNIEEFKFEKNSKKINLAFISPDFRKHPVGYAISNVIKNLKLYNFNLFAYYNFYIEDDLTKQFKKDFNYFNNISNLNDEQIINKIRNDGIHILIDLAGHSANNNLNIFYYNPAPLQISWLGYLPTTGLKEIKYKIGDANIYPKTSYRDHSEKFLNLPNIWSDFSVYEGKNAIKFNPKKDDDYIIFGCFVTLRKINDRVIKLWSKVLNNFPQTKLHFKAPELKDISIEKSLKEKFQYYRVKPEQLILEKSTNYESYLKSYLKIDISLDPFPWNGVTTSFESIWMGVPIFCLESNATYSSSRCSYSINKNLKMNDWIAKDEKDYLYKLNKIISDKNNLLLVKKNLRNYAIKNNLFDSKKFTQNLASKLNQAWKDFVIE